MNDEAQQLVDLFAEAERALLRGASLTDVLAAVRAVHMAEHAAAQPAPERTGTLAPVAATIAAGIRSELAAVEDAAALAAHTWGAQLTVGVLRALLRPYPAAMPVLSDGCDCIGPALDVSDDGWKVCIDRSVDFGARDPGRAERMAREGREREAQQLQRMRDEGAGPEGYSAIGALDAAGKGGAK